MTTRRLVPQALGCASTVCQYRGYSTATSHFHTRIGMSVRHCNKSGEAAAPLVVAESRMWAFLIGSEKRTA
jgi:hypothetical protein